MYTSLSKYFVYTISSLSRNYIYVGIVDNLIRRIGDHNKGYYRTTKPYSPFRTIFTEEFDTRLAVRNKEKYLKSGVGKEFLRSLNLLEISNLSTDR